VALSIKNADEALVFDEGEADRVAAVFAGQADPVTLDRELAAAFAAR
jgi:hypothetical protein